MQDTWAISIAAEHAIAAGRLWHFPGLEVLDSGGVIWIQGVEMSDELTIALRGMPEARRFAVIQGGQLVAVGERVPNGRLPVGNWQPLARWLTLELAPAALAAKLSGWVPLRVVRWEEQTIENVGPACRAGLDSVSQASPASRSGLPNQSRPAGGTYLEPNLLLTDVASWAAYAASAPQARLDRWHFAACDDGRVIVRGAPRPPISGQAFCERDGIAIPIGYDFSPAVEPAVVRELVQLEPNDLALFHADGTWERLAGEQFVRATRSAVRGILN